MSGRRVECTNQDHKYGGGSIPQAGHECEELEEEAEILYCQGHTDWEEE